MLSFKDLIKDVRGATAIEYSLIAALIFLAIVTAVTLVGAESLNNWNAMADAFP